MNPNPPEGEGTRTPGPGPPTPGGHHCLIHGDEDELRATVLPFVREGVRLNRRVLVLRSGAPSPEAALLGRELEAGWPDRIRSGQIRFHTVEGNLHRQGRFDRFQALKFVEQEIRQAREDGFGGLHLVQDGKALEGAGEHLDELSAYEAGLGVVLRDRPCSVLCIYNRWTTPPTVLLRCLDLHPAELGPDLTEGPNPYYRPEVELQEVPWEHVAEERLRFLKWLRERPTGGVAGEGRDALLRSVLRRLEEEGGGVEGAMAASAAELCAALGARKARGYLVDRMAKALVLVGEWELREGASDPMPAKTLERRPLARGEGMPGRAWMARGPVWIPDLAADPDLREDRIPEPSGAKAAVALPLPAGSGVTGVLEFLLFDVREPDEGLLDDLETVARSLGEVVARIRAEEEVADLRDGLEAVLEDAGDGIVLTDPEGRIRSWNWAAARLLGSEGTGVPEGRALEDLLPADVREWLRNALELAALPGKPDLAGGTAELRSVRVGPEGTPVRLHVGSWGAPGEGTRVVVLRDLGEAGARDSEHRLVELVLSRSSREAMVVTTGGARWGGPRIVFANEAFCRMTGFPAAELRGRSFRFLMGPDASGEALEDTWRTLSRGSPASAEFLARRKDGEEFLMRLELSPVRDGRGRVSHFVGTQIDVTREEVVAEALKRADQDPLTGLANRALFNKMLGRAIERCTKHPELRFAVLFLDLDEFKPVNDTYGHVFGDQLLVSVARALEAAVRPGDVLARFGGDEFVILVEFVGGLKDVLAVAERVENRFGQPFRANGKEVRVGTSIGIALSDTGYSSPEEVLRDADRAMYQVKDEGGGGYRIFDPALQEAAAGASRMREELERSLDRGEFSLHYQPLVDLSSDRIAGLELLLRWKHPERGLVPATEFIGQARDMELMVPLGRWVVAQACRQLRIWQDRFPSETPLLLSVNLSSRELVDPRLGEWFRRSLEETGADPGSLLVEIPESFFDLSAKEVGRALEALREVGVRIAIDGFGTGEAALSHLHRYPVDLLKIDPRFVAGLSEEGGPEGREGEGDARALRSILAAGHSLGLQVAAKGVETDRQRSALRDLSCRLAQGYLFSRPVAAEEAETLLRTGWGGNGQELN